MAREWGPPQHHANPPMEKPSASTSWQGLASNSISSIVGYLRGTGKTNPPATATNSSYTLADGYITGVPMYVNNGKKSASGTEGEATRSREGEEGDSVEITRKTVHREKYKTKPEAMEEDYDFLYLQSLLPFIKKIPLDQKLDCRNKIQSIVKYYLVNPCEEKPPHHEQISPKPSDTSPTWSGYYYCDPDPPPAPAEANPNPNLDCDRASPKSSGSSQPHANNVAPKISQVQKSDSKCELKLPNSSAYCKKKFSDPNNSNRQANESNQPQGQSTGTGGPCSESQQQINEDFDMQNSRCQQQDPRSGQYSNSHNLYQGPDRPNRHSGPPDFHYQQQREPINVHQP